MEYFWSFSKAGYGNASSNKLDMRNWTFNTDPNAEIDFNRFLQMLLQLTLLMVVQFFGFLI
ncbi:MAG: hypothetical protein CM15mV51_1610 [uncultured marine virus]|nr:MAG: hypothetical protein CM15mV51_1610 [uncultured marine virus]